jgi:ATP-binding cassette subfamily C (CFTR/MRP) protein 1
MEKVDQKKWEINDLRIKMMNEILSGIKVIKLYGWEESFKKIITKIRNNQMDYLREQHYLGLKSECFWDSMPWILMIVAFGSFILLNDSSKFTLNVVFVSVSLFNIIRSPLDDFSNIITTIITLKVSIERLSSFLLKEEINDDEIGHDNLGDIVVRFSNVSMGWDHEKAALKNLNLDIKRGKLIAIVGRVGCGKSSFLSALLGEMNKLNDGLININGSIAYIQQQGILFIES